MCVCAGRDGGGGVYICIFSGTFHFACGMCSLDLKLTARVCASVHAACVVCGAPGFALEHRRSSLIFVSQLAGLG